MSQPQVDRVGRASLWIAVAGLAAGLALFVLARVLGSELSRVLLVIAAIVVPIAEIAALILGVLSRATPAGAAGLAVSIVVLVLYVLVILYLVPIWVVTTPASAP